MFERYTQKARRVIFFARYEASSFGSPHIEPEHLLLGLLHEDKDLAEQFLPGHREEVEQSIREVKEQREPISTSIELPLSHASERILAYGVEEAERLRQQHTGTAHLLLGLLREPSRAQSVLTEYGLTVGHVRDQMAKQQGRVDPPSPALLFQAIRNRFSPLTKRLTQENEPAVVFFVRSLK